jgi:CRISPR-associated protein Csb1
LICLRRLRFPINGETGTETDQLARTLLAALGICGATLAFESGIGLRSRSLLWPEGPMVWELLDRPGVIPRQFKMTGNNAVTLFNQTINVAEQSKLPWLKEILELKPSAELLKLVRLSQLQAKKEEPKGGA